MYEQWKQRRTFVQQTHQWESEGKPWGGKDIFTNYYDKRQVPTIQKGLLWINKKKANNSKEKSAKDLNALFIKRKCKWAINMWECTYFTSHPGNAKQNHQGISLQTHPKGQNWLWNTRCWQHGEQRKFSFGTQNGAKTLGNYSWRSLFLMTRNFFSGGQLWECVHKCTRKNA